MQATLRSPLLLCIAAAMVKPASALPPAPKPQMSVESTYTVGYHDWQGLPEFSVFANGTTIVNTTLEPSLSYNTMKPSVAKSLKVTPLTQTVAFTFLHNHFTASGAANVNLGIGNGGVLPVNVGLLNIMASLSPAMAHRPDAPAIWLGYPFLKRFQVRFNPSNHLIEFIPGSHKTKLKPGAVIVKFAGTGAAPAVNVTVPGSPPFTAVVSVTSPVTILPPEVAAKLAGTSPMQIPVRLPDGTETHVEGIKVSSLSVGRAKVDGMQVLGAEPANKSATVPTAVLGMDFLQHFRFTIDFVGKRLVLEPLDHEVAKPQAKTQPADAHDGFNPR